MAAIAKPLTLMVNQRLVYEYDRNQRLPGKQREFLDVMDQDMAAGIEIDDIFYPQPEQQQRISYVAANLAHAYHAKNEALMKATSAWLALRSPDLIQLIVEENGEEFSLQLKFAKEEEIVDDSSTA
ncbi:MAG: hypothetical protein OEX12_10635 [Gammaproteobacteria bacterium]|nr:hypothetical protein [Gammaproteobacteria bacterium]